MNPCFFVQNSGKYESSRNKLPSNLTTTLKLNKIFFCIIAEFTVEHLTDNLDCIETLSRLLDTEYKLSLYLKYWKHLADKLGMPKEIREKISRFSKCSPSEDFFEYLFATKPQLTLSQFASVLHSKERFDVMKILQHCVAGIVKQF